MPFTFQVTTFIVALCSMCVWEEKECAVWMWLCCRSHCRHHCVSTAAHAMSHCHNVIERHSLFFNLHLSSMCACWVHLLGDSLSWSYPQFPLSSQHRAT